MQYYFLWWVTRLKTLWINLALQIIALRCFKALHNWVVVIPMQAQFARRTPCLLVSVTSWSCWVAALSGRSKDSAVSPVDRSQAYTPTNSGYIPVSTGIPGQAYTIHWLTRSHFHELHWSVKTAVYNLNIPSINKKTIIYYPVCFGWWGEDRKCAKKVCDLTGAFKIRC